VRPVKEPEIWPAKVDTRARAKNESRTAGMSLDLMFLMAIDSKGEVKSKRPTI
jgi:hypothetical protein